MVRLASSALAIVAPNGRSKLSRTLIARAGLIDRWISTAEKVRDRTRPLVWFHAPSVGEGLQARPIIDALRRARPDVQIAYSFFSPSAESFAKSLNVDIADYLPFDGFVDAHQLIDALSPTALFFVKLDVWPQLVAVAKQKGVKVGLLSGTVAPASGRMGTMSRAILEDAYRALDVVGAIDQANGERLISLGVQRDRLSVSGDTRFDQVWARAQGVNRNSALLQSLASTRPTLVAGSTWPADEEVLLTAWNDVRKRVPNARMIIAPHEPTAEHLTPIQTWAREHGLSIVTLGELLAGREREANVALPASNSRITREAETHTTTHEFEAAMAGDAFDIVLVDRVGVLGDIYAIADLAFVGGAFHKAGLHSVLEPAAYGVPVVFGPRYLMSREAGLLLLAGGAQSVSTRAECARAIEYFLANPDSQAARGQSAMAFVESELGAAQYATRKVLDFVTDANSAQ